VSIAVGVVFIMWFYRAAANAWAAGLPARRSPLLAALSFVIPILNLWWPYQSTLDMLPVDDPRRSLVGRWWLAWLFGALCQAMLIVAAFTMGRTAVDVIAVVGGVSMIVAAVLARAVVLHVTGVHERIVDVPVS
jgi:hypothetical protein